MRIAMMSYHTSPLAALGGKHSGGMNVYVRELSTELARLGHTVDIFTRSTKPAIEIIANEVRLVSIPAGPKTYLPLMDLARHIPEFAERVVHFARDEGIDYQIVHAHYWMSGLAAIQLKQTWTLPMVLMFHTLGLVKNRIAILGQLESDARIRGERRALAAADRVVAATPAERADLQWLYELRSDKVSVIPPGVDLQLFHPTPKGDARRALAWPQEERIVLYVGRIEALKGIETLVRSVQNLRASQPDLQLRVEIIGGDIEERFEALESEMGRLRALTRELGLQEQVRFLGSRSQQELPTYYAAADVVAMPSYAESFGMVALEAMACGRPVITSRVGGLAYLVRDGETGYHVQEGNPEELAGRLAELLKDKNRLEAMGQAARKEAEKYSWERTAGEIEKLYLKLISGDEAP